MNSTDSVVYNDMPTKTELAWLGGIIDGEGHIGVHARKKSGQHAIRISITNTDEGILKECKKILDKLGIFYIFLLHKDRARKSHHKDVYVIEMNRIAECKEFLQIIKPYIRAQAKQRKILEVEMYIYLKRRKDGRALNNIPKYKKRAELLLFTGTGGK